MTPRIISWSGIALCVALLLPISTEGADRDRTGTIKINGRWTITVTNADRSVASRREFNNALTAQGAELMARLIAGSTSSVIDKWRVTLRSTSGANPCATAAGLHLECFIREVGDNSSFAHSSNLLVGTTGSALVLQGSIKATLAGAIDDVSTFITNSNTTFAGQLTRHTLSPAIAVQAGQTIDVRVVISLS